MANFLGSLISGRSYLGVDIGTTSIKAVEIEKSAGLPKLVNYGILESFGHLKRLNDAIQTSSLKPVARDIAGILTLLLEKANFRTKEAIVSIPAFSAFVTFLEIPKMPNADTLRTLQFQIPRYIPLSPDEMSLDWMKVGEYEDEKGLIKQKILLTAVPNEKVAVYRDLFRLAGLKLKFLEVESLSLIRSVAAHQKEPILIVDIGSRSTNIIVTENGFFEGGAQTDFASASLSQGIANGLGINIARADELKKQKGLLVKAEEQELSTLMLPFLDAIITEARRVKDSYEKSKNKRIEAVILSGGGSKLLGIAEYLENQFGVPVSLGNPFLRVTAPQEIEIVLRDLSPLLGVAIGLGIKEFV
ncbi:type IV pilus assembly protein PilM [Candidatus Wolfebacteria bacterium]|nr:type IV pilus assembly protein PilM [Candidatus Wolfebacteria bacterium]